MKTFKVGELVRDILNKGDGAYGIGIILGESTEPFSYNEHSAAYDEEISGLRYNVYFTKFERTMVFHAHYLQTV